MDVHVLLELAVSLSNRLDTHWTLFVTVHMALIGGIIYVDRPLKGTEKTAAILIYTGFAVINLAMMRNQMLFLNSVYQDIMGFADEPCCKESSTLAYINDMGVFGSLKSAIWMLLTIHGVMYLLVVASILRDKARGE